MGNLSKYLKAASLLDCNAFHPNLSCTQSALYALQNNLIASVKIFAPIALLPLLKKPTELNKATILDALKFYLKIGTNSAIASTFGIIINCLLQRILPKKLLWLKIPISMYVAVYFAVFATPRFQSTITDAIYQACLELFITDKNIIGRTIIESKFKSTLLFTLTNIIILHGHHYYNTRGLWLTTTNQWYSDKMESTEYAAEQSKTKRCHFHKNQSCQSYILKSVRNYFMLGLIFDVIDFVKNWHKQSSQRILMNSTIFFTLYAILYKLTHCSLNHYYDNNDVTNHFVASCVAGLSFLWHPNMSVLYYSIIQAIQTLWLMLDRNCIKMKNEKKIVEILLNFPYGKILCPASASIGFFIYVLQTEHSSALIGHLINGVTGNYIYHARKILQEKLKEVS